MSTTTTNPSTHATYTTQVTLKDGTTASHTAEALRYWVEGDGSVVVEASCCGGESGVSRHTFYDVSGRALSDGTQAIVIDPEAEVRAHVQRVAEHHAGVHRARSFNLDGLMKPVAAQ